MNIRHVNVTAVLDCLTKPVAKYLFISYTSAFVLLLSKVIWMQCIKLQENSFIIKLNQGEIKTVKHYYYTITA